MGEDSLRIETWN